MTSRGDLEITIMRSFELHLASLSLVALALAGCPGDDSGTTVGDTANDTGMTTAADTADTDPGTTTAPEGTSTTDAPDETTAEGTTTGELVLGDVEVTVIYDGAAMGTLNVVAITSFPPVGPPLAVASEMDPAYPWVGTLMGLEPGEYYIAAVLDVGNDNPTLPGPEDLQAVTDGPLVIDGPGPFMVELTLMDPA